MEQEQIANEARLRPREGDRVRVGQNELVWTAARNDDYRIDFNRFLGRGTTNSVAYAVAYIMSDTDKTGLVVKTGSDDLARLFLNGKEISQRPVGVGWIPPIAVPTPPAPQWIEDEDQVSGLQLKAGLNVLIFKVANSQGRWEGSVWLTAADGQPVKGIRVALSPE